MNIFEPLKYHIVVVFQYSKYTVQNYKEETPFLGPNNALDFIGWQTIILNSLPISAAAMM